MKKRLSYIFLFVVASTSGFAQSTVKFIHADTKEPVSEVYFSILKNETTFHDCGGTDSEGYACLEITDVDSSASYHLSFDRPEFEPVWKEIDTNSTDTSLIELIPDDYYLENTEHVYAKGCNSISFLGYQPREPRSLDDIPVEIAEKVTSYLKSRVGDTFFPSIRLINGQIVDLDTLQKVYKAWNNSKTAYYSCFSYRR